MRERNGARKKEKAVSERNKEKWVSARKTEDDVSARKKGTVVRARKKEDQNTNILLQADWPELPYEDEFCKKSLYEKNFGPLDDSMVLAVFFQKRMCQNRSISRRRVSGDIYHQL